MPVSPISSAEDQVHVRVWVVPGASRTRVDGLHGDMVKVRVTSPAEGGRANEAVSEALEKTVGAPVRLIRGMRSRSKVFQVTGSDVDTVRRKLGLR